MSNLKKQLIIICNASNPSNSMDNLDDGGSHYQLIQRRRYQKINHP